jgi:hypothetical protein
MVRVGTLHKDEINFVSTLNPSRQNSVSPIKQMVLQLLLD